MSHYEESTHGAPSAAQALKFRAEQTRRELAAMPPKLRDETLERARRCARPGSYLFKHLKELYGTSSNE